MSDLSKLTAALADRYTIERRLGAGGMATSRDQSRSFHYRVRLSKDSPSFIGCKRSDAGVSRITPELSQ